MIHLDDIPPGGDMRQYPWQRLVNAVRRACKITVAPPLEMHQSWSGTVISLNAPATALMGSNSVPAYSWQATASTSVAALQTDPTNAAAVVAFDTPEAGVTQSTIFGSLSGGALPIAGTGIMRFVVNIELYGSGASDNFGQATAWIQKKPTGGAWADVANSAGRTPIIDRAAGTNVPGRICLNELIPVTKNDTYRIKCINSNGTITVSMAGDDGTPIGNEVISPTTMWSITAEGPVTV